MTHLLKHALNLLSAFAAFTATIIVTMLAGPTKSAGSNAALTPRTSSMGDCPPPTQLGGRATQEAAASQHRLRPFRQREWGPIGKASSDSGFRFGTQAGHGTGRWSGSRRMDIDSRTEPAAARCLRS
jgi:hypothetical protein